MLPALAVGPLTTNRCISQCASCSQAAVSPTPRIGGRSGLPALLALTGATAARNHQSRSQRAMGQSAQGKSDAKVEAYFKDKVVWVTGASGGFGEALCVALSRGAKLKGLVLSARRKEELERVRSRCLEFQPELHAVVLPVDLADTGSLQKKAEVAASFFGSVDVLVNNGGVGFRGLGSETTIESDRLVMEIDYFSGVMLTKALLPAWLASQSGHVVQVSSVQGFFGMPGRTAYSAAKHAAVGYYDSLRAEVADFGVTVTTVCPGYIATGHSQNAVYGSAGKYPEGHTSKGVSPDVLALEVLAAVARRRPQLVSAALDARVACLLRALCPALLFWIMRRRARKERRERAALAEAPVDSSERPKLA